MVVEARSRPPKCGHVRERLPCSAGYREQVVRTALKPRWLALLVLVLVAASIMSRLGQWQLDRARENGSRGQQQEQARPAAPLAGVLQARRTFPGTAVNRYVSATGTWDAVHQLLVVDRRDTTSVNGDTAGPHGLWVLTPLRLPDGSAVPVVRGWVAASDDPAATTSAVPGGTVTVTGYLQPSEPPNDDRSPGESANLPAGQVELVDVTHVIKVWPYPLTTGYLLLSGQSPASATAPAHLVKLQEGDSALALQNLSYAIQWFVFSGFGMYVWWRLVREDHRGAPGRGGRSGGGSGSDVPIGRVPDAGTGPARTAAGPVGEGDACPPAVGGTRP
jgi:cytochrome oxidase assembly protein ShyY1